jgi:putative selenium metabolism hydrolase
LSTADLAVRIRELASGEREYAADLLQRLIRVPSPSCEEGEVIDLLIRELTALGPDEVFMDAIGNAVARFGDRGPVILYDSHTDTVGVGDRTCWEHDPYAGVRAGDVIHGRGASDNKAGVAGMVTALKVLRRLGEPPPFTLYVVGIVQEEDCEGLALESFMDERSINPDCVLLGECTDLGINRGHRGRAEVEIVTHGRSCHASTPELGDNAIYKMTSIVDSIRWMGNKLPSDEFLGQGTIAVTSVDCSTPSLNAVPDGCRIYLDRRVVPNDTEDSVTRELDEIARHAGGVVRLSRYERASHTGLVRRRTKFFPAWTLPEDAPAVEAGVRTSELLFESRPKVGKWDFSTDGNFSMGKRNIPTIGYGPGLERHAHAADDQVGVDDLSRAVAFYSLFPFVFAG